MGSARLIYCLSVYLPKTVQAFVTAQQIRLPTFVAISRDLIWMAFKVITCSPRFIALEQTRASGWYTWSFYKVLQAGGAKTISLYLYCAVKGSDVWQLFGNGFYGVAKSYQSDNIIYWGLRMIGCKIVLGVNLFRVNIFIGQ